MSTFRMKDIKKSKLPLDYSYRLRHEVSGNDWKYIFYGSTGYVCMLMMRDNKLSFRASRCKSKIINEISLIFRYHLRTLNPDPELCGSYMTCPDFKLTKKDEAIILNNFLHLASQIKDNIIFYNAITDFFLADLNYDVGYSISRATYYV